MQVYFNCNNDANVKEILKTGKKKINSAHHSFADRQIYKTNKASSTT
jgi:hypothetical protein